MNKYILICIFFFYTSDVRSDNYGNILNPYMCFNQNYTVCDSNINLKNIIRENDLKKFLNEEIKYSEAIKDDKCYLKIAQIASNILLENPSNKSAICLSSKLSEYALENTWRKDTSKKLTHKTPTESLTLGVAYDNLDVIYLNGWKEVRSFEGSNIAQCFHAVSILEEKIKYFMSIRALKEDHILGKYITPLSSSGALDSALYLLISSSRENKYSKHLLKHFAEEKQISRIRKKYKYFDTQEQNQICTSK